MSLLSRIEYYSRAMPRASDVTTRQIVDVEMYSERLVVGRLWFRREADGECTRDREVPVGRCCAAMSRRRGRRVRLKVPRAGSEAHSPCRCLHAFVCTRKRLSVCIYTHRCTYRTVASCISPYPIYSLTRMTNEFLARSRNILVSTRLILTISLRHEDVVSYYYNAL